MAFPPQDLDRELIFCFEASISNALYFKFQVFKGIICKLSISNWFLSENSKFQRFGSTRENSTSFDYEFQILTALSLSYRFSIISETSNFDFQLVSE